MWLEFEYWSVMPGLSVCVLGNVFASVEWWGTRIEDRNY